jgi:hypothetical protein
MQVTAGDPISFRPATCAEQDVRGECAPHLDAADLAGEALSVARHKPLMQDADERVINEVRNVVDGAGVLGPNIDAASSMCS